MAGYDGYSKSNNAVNAESEGRYPMTRAKQIVAEKTGLSQKEAERILTALHRGEWHHSSKMYNAVKYYDTTVAILVVEFARENGLELGESYFKTIFAWGLNEVMGWEEFEEAGENSFSGENQTKEERIAEFIKAVKTEKWM